jgi:hypothetical protein
MGRFHSGRHYYWRTRNREGHSRVTDAESISHVGTLRSDRSGGFNAVMETARVDHLSDHTVGPRPVAALPHEADPRRCAILVPFASHIVPACEEGLIELQRRGYEVWRVGGYANIDIGRNEIVTKALAAGFEETFWIDSDIEFDPASVERLRAYGLPITSGIYVRKGARALGSQTLPGMTKLGVGTGGGLCEILYAATGFLHVRREVYTTIQQKLALPVCNEGFGRPMVPFFQPMIRKYEGGHWYLGDDYSFCERARQCGYKIMADTSIRLWHIGEYAYGWEDAGLDRVRHDSFLFLISDGNKA